MRTLLLILLTALSCTAQVRVSGTAHITGTAHLKTTHTVGGGGGGVCDSINDASLVAYWKLEEASGTRSDSKGANTLTESSATSSAGGKIGNAAAFTGSSYLFISDNAALSMGSHSFSVLAWVYITEERTFQGVVDKPTEYRLVSTGNDWEFVVYDSVSGSSSVVINQALATNTWYLFAARYDHGQKKATLSINAGTVSTSSTALANGPIDGTQLFHIGVDTARDYSRVRLDEVLVSKRLLTDEEVSAFYAAGAGCRPTL